MKRYYVADGDGRTFYIWLHHPAKMSRRSYDEMILSFSHDDEPEAVAKAFAEWLSDREKE